MDLPIPCLDASMDDRADNRVSAAIGWMVVTGLLFVCVTALVKLLGTTLPAAQASFLRYILGLVFVVPVLWRSQLSQINVATWRLFVWRGLAHSFGVSLWFYAMARIPIADVTAMNYLAPIYVTLGAALFLGERLHLRRLLAVAGALIGALIILRPGLREVSPGHWAMIFAALAFGASYLMAKRLSDVVNPALVVTMLSITVAIGLAPVALANWVRPDLYSLGVLFIVASAATAAHYTMTLAFAAAPVTVTQPVTFLQLLWAVLLGYFVFDEGLDIWVVIGGLVILGAVTFITWREAVLKRRLTPPSPATKL